MNLVGRARRAAGGRGRAPRACASPPPARSDRQQAEPAGDAAGRFDRAGIGDALAEHLIAAADADRRWRRAACCARTHASRPCRSQPGEVAERVLGAGQDDEVVALVRRRRGDPVGPVEQAEVGGVRQVRGSCTIAMAAPAGGGAARAAIDGEAVLGVDAQVLGVGKHTEARRAGVRLEEACGRRRRASGRRGTC